MNPKLLGWALSVTAINGLNTDGAIGATGLIADFNNGVLVGISGAAVTGDYSFNYTVSDGTNTDTANVSLKVWNTTTEQNVITLTDNDFSYINAQPGPDTITGDLALVGNAGIDILVGGLGADVLTGGAGNDTMYAGAGGTTGSTISDTFVFAAGFGHDIIGDFDANPNGTQDFLNIHAYGFTAGMNFDANVLITDAGNDTLVTIGADTITLLGVSDHTTVTQADFIL